MILIGFILVDFVYWNLIFFYIEIDFFVGCVVWYNLMFMWWVLIYGEMLMGIKIYLVYKKDK